MADYEKGHNPCRHWDSNTRPQGLCCRREYAIDCAAPVTHYGADPYYSAVLYIDDVNNTIFYY
jgi:hypothetical protein